jgi:hypothetical protein
VAALAVVEGLDVLRDASREAASRAPSSGRVLFSNSSGVEIGWRGTWDRIAEAVEALRQRRVRGKAVLDVRPGAP